MQIEYILLPKLKLEIRRAYHTRNEVYLCCMPRPAVPAKHMHSMQHGKCYDISGHTEVREKIPTQIHK